MDGRLYSTLVDSSISIQPQIKVHCTRERQCREIDLDNTSSLVFHDQGKCRALLTREGFFDFQVLPAQCNVSHSVAVVCQHTVNENVVFTSNMSDIKLSFVDGFHSIQMFSSCDPGWFMVDNVCINFYLCRNCSNSAAREQCSMFGGHLAYHVLKNVTISTPGNKLDKNTKLSFFWDMFHHVEDISPAREAFKRRHFFYYKWISVSLPKQQKFLIVNDSALCVALYNSSDCKEGDIVLSVGYHSFPFTDFSLSGYVFYQSHDRPDPPMWSFIYQPIFQRAYKYRNLSLCEKSVAHAPILTNCSDFYMSCDEGTCIHDSLACDGHAHCPHGEDEADCEHVCSDHSHNCTSHCHHRDLCSCLPGYFQCLSGGCVPLQKLCDKTVHCIDKSDEPPTCVYMRPEQLGNHLLTLNISIHQNMVGQQVCLQTTNESLIHVQNVEYQMHSKQQRCSRSSLSPDRKFSCGIFHDIPVNPIRDYFSLDRLCVYEQYCGDNYDVFECFNGFHLLKCKHMYCVGRFKCPSSYCISLADICNKVCDCPNCEDEKICSKLLCPGMVLIEQIGSGLRCSMDVASLKYSMNFRQVIHKRDVNITDDFPVFIHLEGVINIGHFITAPEFVVYCEIRYSNFNSLNDSSIFHRMISVRRLLLPRNDIEDVHDLMFITMSQLVLLDLSHNRIKYLPQVILCALQNLQYISLQHNMIAELPAGLFVNNPNVVVLLLQSNNLKPQSVIIDASLSLLYHFSSDIPRLCCVFKGAKLCSPPFPLLVSCSNFITSKALIVLSWLIGLSTSILNLFCLSLLVCKLFMPATQTPRVVMLYSVNLSFAELVTSLCLLSYSVINVVYNDEFGIIADQWRHSLKCLSLESLFSVSSRLCLAFALCLSVHFAIHIPSVIPRKSSPKATFFQIIVLWLIIASICITLQVLEQMLNIDPFNYFCFPFTTSFPTDPLILGLQSVLLILDIILIIATIVCHGYLLVFAIRRSKNKTLQNVGKRKERLQKLGARLTILIMSTVLTWIPVVCVQILSLAKITILPNIYFWCILISFPINLIIDPILLIRNMLA